MPRYQHGLVLGKFMPLHNGHVFLIETALSESARLTVILFSESSDPIPGSVRVEWIQSLYPTVSVIHYTTPLPRDESGIGHWDTWRDAVQSATNGLGIDAVFTSETYGDRLALDLCATHVLVDRDRTTVPARASDIRQDPVKYWEALPDCVRLYYT